MQILFNHCDVLDVDVDTVNERSLYGAQTEEQ